MHEPIERGVARAILAAREVEHSPEWNEFTEAQSAFFEVSRQLDDERRMGKESDPALVKLQSEATAFFEGLFPEWEEEGSLSDDMRGYAIPGKTPPLSQWERKVEASQGGKE